ncbi:MAG: OmpA/MotB family protein [Planctomycetota bacterium]
MARGRRRTKKPEPTKRGVPAYMTSFADMMTLMLTFFILLVSFAEEQRAELVAAGTGSFVNAIETLGLPGLLPGGRRTIEMGQVPANFTIPAHHLEKSEELLSRHLRKAPPERLRRSTIEYHLRHKHGVVLATSVRFVPRTAELARGSRQELDAVAAMAWQSRSHVGIEAHAHGPGDGWELSALRAAAVARYLRQEGLIPYARMTLAGYGSFQPLAQRGAGRRSDDRINILLSPESLD